MIRNNILSRFILVTLTAALLLVSGSRAICVSALADVVPDVAPVFDTQIYQLQDYIDHGALGEPQLDIFYIMAGLYAVGQMGAEDYRLNNPYTSDDDILTWLKDVGIQSYNTLIGLAPDTLRLADGTLISTDVYKRVLSAYVADLFGCAVKASEYNSVSDFTDDVANSSHYFIPWSSQIQYGLNTLYRLHGGFYEWQFGEGPFTTSVDYKSYNMSASIQTDYNTYLTRIQSPYVRLNDSDSNYFYRDIRFSYNTDYFETYRYLFVNTTDHSIQVVNSSGLTNNPVLVSRVYSYNNGSMASYTTSFNMGALQTIYYNPNSYSRIIDVVRDVYNGVLNIAPNTSRYFIFLEDFIQHVYVGDSWPNRHEIFNVRDLNIEDSDQPYYDSVPEDEPNYLLDIKGILQDILNNTDLHTVFINNIYTPDGVLVHDTDLIRISLRLLQDYELDNPPLPVNLNDVAEYTDNTYMDLVKERASSAGSALAALVAFWHNCDAELIYVMFGAGLTVLVGAFIGKWGHS